MPGIIVFKYLSSSGVLYYPTSMLSFKHYTLKPCNFWKVNQYTHGNISWCSYWKMCRVSMLGMSSRDSCALVNRSWRPHNMCPRRLSIFRLSGSVFAVYSWITPVAAPRLQKKGGLLRHKVLSIPLRLQCILSTIKWSTLNDINRLGQQF